MLKSLVNGTLGSPIVVIEDSRSCDGVPLLLSFILKLGSDKKNKVHVLCFEHPSDIEQCPSFPNLHFHDCYSDPRRWNVDAREEAEEIPPKECSLLDAVRKTVGTNAGDIILVVDSMSLILFNSGLSQCYKDLHSLIYRHSISGTRPKQVICLVHRDFILDRDSVISRLHHLSTTYLQVAPPVKKDVLVAITHKKPGGGVTKRVEEFSCDALGRVTSSVYRPTPQATTSAAGQTSGMARLTTFKLDLHEKEKEARRNLVLPYQRSAKKRDESSGGKVFYVPDAADDWDEEDPDDDLNL